MTPRTVIRVLGPLEVERAGEPVRIGSPMQRRLLTALVVAHGETVSTDGLIAALWGDDPPTSARNSLQTYVARLRDRCGDPHLVVTRPPGYALDTARVTVDAWTFRDGVRRARHIVDRDPAGVAAALTASLEAWRGDAYGEFEDGPTRETARRTADLRLEAAELLASAHLRSGAPSEAVAALDRFVDPAALHEPTTILKARALARAGRPPDALAVVRRFRDRLADELGLDPSPALDDLEQRLLRGEIVGDDAAPERSDRTQTPVAAPQLVNGTVGRDADVARVEAALRTAPLVTLVGPGGVGKTRLATVLASRIAAVAWIDLAPVHRGQDVAPAFADGLGLAIAPGRAVERTVVEALAGSTGTVIVDNCEHLLDPVAELLHAALTRSQEVRILTTSRERLDVAGELAVPVVPLRVPSRAAATSDDPAVRLFLDRLIEAGGRPVPASDAADVVAAADGLPLAIELAAARAASLPITDLVARLRERIDVLAGTRRRHGDRHRTLEQVVTWSHDLLEPTSQALFRRLSVFATTFGLEDAERICADDHVPTAEVASELARLVEVSMVTRLDDGRFRLLEPLRLYAAARLSASDEAAALHERQRRAALELTARADAEISGPDETPTVLEVEAALPDLRAVHARALACGDLDTVATMAAQLYRFAYLRARSDILRWGAELAGTAGNGVAGGVRARALAAAATGTWLTGDLAQAVELVAASRQFSHDPWSRITLAEVAGDVALAVGDLDGAITAFTDNLACAETFGHLGLTAQAEVSLAYASFLDGDQRGAEALVRSGMDRANASRAPSVRALAEYTLGEVLVHDPDGALEAFARARSIAAAGGARFHEGLARTADVALRGRHGPPDEALRRYRDAIELWRDTGADGLLLTTLRNLVVLLVRTGADTHALGLQGVIDRLGVRPSFGDEARRLAGATAAARERLGADGVVSAAEVGADVVDLRTAAELALRMIADASAGPPPAAGADSPAP